LGKNNNITVSNCKSFSTSEINISSEIVHVKAQIDKVAIKIEAIESQLSTVFSSTDVYTNDELKDEKKYLLDKEKKSLQNQLQILYERLPKGINIYKYFYYIYVIYHQPFYY
jgi:hypothetical protein